MNSSFQIWKITGLSILVMASIFLTCYLSLDFFKNKNNPHEYIEVKIIEKNFEPGYGGFYGGNPPVYIVKAQSSKENGSIIVVNRSNNSSLYDFYEIGDILEYCTVHKELKILEKERE